MRVSKEILELAHRLLYRPALFPSEGIAAGDVDTLLDKLRAGRVSEQLPPDGELSRQAELCERRGIRALLSGEPHYPEGLRVLAKPPPAIFVRGMLPVGEKAAALVGSRRCSRQGRQFAKELARSLAGAGLPVISGLARGIDAAAHMGALETGCTVAVLGGGLDRIYPPEHESLARQVEERGALISEFPPGTVPLPFHFPRRNRVIAAMADITVVIEAGRKSGALITAGQARDLGRDVGVVPGNPLNPSAAGSNRLLYDGVEPVLGPREVFEMIQWRGGWIEGRPWDPKRCVEEEVDDVETLALRAGWSLSRAMRKLEEWEAEDRVTRLGGGRFRVEELAAETVED